MTDSFLKREIEASNRLTSKKRLIGLVVGSGLLCLCSVSVFLWSKNASTTQARESVLTSENVAQNGFEEPKSTSNPERPGVTPSIPQTASRPAHATTSQPTQPAAPSIDRNAYIADANKTLAAYSQITELLNFNASTSDAVKTSRIKQAIAIDKQSFSQVTNLRGHLVWAGVTSGKYIELTEQAESGVSKISTGLTFMGYWLNDHSRTSDLDSGLGSVNQGAQLLLQFSGGVNAL